MRKNRLFRFLGLTFLVGTLMVGYGLYHLGVYDFIEAAQNGRYQLGFNTFATYSQETKGESGLFQKKPFHFTEHMKVLQHDAIHISVSSENVYVVYNNGDDVNVQYYGGLQSVGKLSSPNLIVEDLDDIINISVFQNNDFALFKNYDGRLIVSLPKQYSGRLVINGTSSDVYLPHGTFEKLEIYLTSGEINQETFQITDGDKQTISEKAGQIQVKEMFLNSTSGDVNFESIDFEKALVNSTSGQIHLLGSKDVDTLEVFATSGDVMFSGTVGNMTVNTTSGNIQLENAVLTGEVYLYTTSGDVTLKDTGSDLQVRYITSSGSCHTNGLKVNVIEEAEDNYLILMGDATVEMTVSTSSGNFNME